MDILINPATGLPEVPEGCFWRVEETYRGSDYLHVKLMETVRPKTRFRRATVRTLGYKICPKTEADTERILWEATRVAKRVNQFAGRDWRKLVGDYPPKSLNPQRSVVLTYSEGGSPFVQMSDAEWEQSHDLHRRGM